MSEMPSSDSRVSTTSLNIIPRNDQHFDTLVLHMANKQYKNAIIALRQLRFVIKLPLPHPFTFFLAFVYSLLLSIYAPLEACLRYQFPQKVALKTRKIFDDKTLGEKWSSLYLIRCW